MTDLITPITMPKFGLAMTEGKIASWNIPPGGHVDAGQEIADIETTKITNGYESPASGTLRRQIATEGETLPVGALLGVLAEPAVNDADIDVFIAKFQTDFSSDSAASTQADHAEPVLVSVGELTLRVQEAGQGSGTPLLFIHGFGGDLTNWMLNQNSLSTDRRTIAFDLPGHGGSSKIVGDGKPATFAATAAALLDKLDVTAVHVVGHSLGGAIALELAKAFPQKVASLSLIAPAGLGQGINMDFIEGFISADRRKTLEPVLNYLVHDKTLISRKMIEDIIRFKRLDGALQSLQTIAQACFPNGRQADDIRPALTAFSGPSQIIWGAEDEILSPADAKGLPDTITVTILPQAGHMPQLENAPAVNAAITQFVK
ncbi:acetoin dehydrogenase dihydrolipoyllysine-residue acetyltransferase subunit [Acetobacter lambici]|uniref:Acetoin dehydrogenase dihydrolipoyllysine-residue acetyltransferase subunit n=1 Tax=Acetobacter lambici TaxID=1332824 RepID=A0ABT1F1K2_9PROT|nr:acetoin dehydrogenase dihydrolipoyllysine-residue acetyltransferase subunit [Acetobacter lambici]MCP1242867.1 acetoin dehydrogenase dihydrolipoyllysine-residue acetyltransferase subunit [Acetobacter lambici]MCP1259038.1 acetoin dehydrogenase dihydrolipoyllysine-residue acetyltransferase subunit [Acetobacter lambici]NHO57232.1 acetoin dehydrogenase dihydrolipoyllysine-residue acetyltransferase subunit [Acetobacter lambici]